MREFDPNKPVQTRHDLPARLLGELAGGRLAFAVQVRDRDDETMVSTCACGMLQCEGPESPYDIVNVPEPAVSAAEENEALSDVLIAALATHLPASSFGPLLYATFDYMSRLARGGYSPDTSPGKDVAAFGASLLVAAMQSGADVPGMRVLRAA